jgi:hypothetical protein
MQLSMKTLISMLFFASFLSPAAFARPGVVAHCTQLVEQSGRSCGHLNGGNGERVAGTLDSADLELTLSSDAGGDWASVNGMIGYTDGRKDQLSIFTYAGSSAWRARIFGESGFTDTDKRLEIVKTESDAFMGFRTAQKEASYDKRSGLLTFKYRVGLPVVCKATFQCVKAH